MSEDILVFYRKLPTYNPQKTSGHPRKVSTAEHKRNSKMTEDYQTKAGKAHGFNRGMIGRTLELLWEKFQNNSFLYIFMCL